MGDRVTRIAFSGELSIARYPEIHDGFATCSERAKRILIDLSDVHYVDSTFLTELLLFAKRRAENGAALAIVASPGVARILALTRIETRIKVFQRPEDAIKLLRELVPTCTDPACKNPENGKDVVPAPEPA